MGSLPPMHRRGRLFLKIMKNIGFIPLTLEFFQLYCKTKFDVLVKRGYTEETRKAQGVNILDPCLYEIISLQVS
jgi:hypothetical protein